MVGALSGSCGYSLLIAVITAVISWMIAITKGGNHFNHFFFIFNFSPPFYGFIITRYRVICKYFFKIFLHKKKTLPSYILVRSFILLQSIHESTCSCSGDAWITSQSSMNYYSDCRTRSQYLG